LSIAGEAFLIVLQSKRCVASYALKPPTINNSISMNAAFKMKVYANIAVQTLKKDV